MKAYPTHSGAERVGRQLGRAWRMLLGRDAVRWMTGRGMSSFFAGLLLWIARLSVFAILLYVAFWLALVVLLVMIVAAFVGQNDESSEPEWLAKNPADHREDLFYHPLTYNDDPDPRFKDN